MKYDLIKAYDYLLVVSDDEIKNNDKVYVDSNNILQIRTYIDPFGETLPIGKKIIAHLTPNNSSILEGVDLLPPLPQGDDVEKLSENFLKDLQVASASVNRSVKLGFEVGYNIAKETYKYTEDDMINAFKLGERGIKYQDHFADVWEDFKKLLQQQPKLPIAFECEMWYNEFAGKKTIKTITNSQGQTQWVGEYIYN
jgi:hypothetical protein